MRLSPVLVVLAASSLITIEALSAAMNSNHAEAAKVASVGGTNQGLLRVQPFTDGDEGTDDSPDDSSDERTLTPDQINKLKRLAGKLDINWKKAQTNGAYLTAHRNYDQYQAKLNKYIQRNKKPGPPSITYHESY